MREIIDRMMVCGVPAQTAACIYRYFWLNGKESDLRQYVEIMEAESVDRISA